MASRSSNPYKKAFSKTIYVPNTVVVPSDAVVDEEKVVLTIRLFNDELIPVFDASPDISVEIKDPDDDILRPPAEDYTEKDGTYKVHFVAIRTGNHIAHVIINGKCINTAGYKFSALGQYSYNKRKHSFRSSPRLTAGDGSPRIASRMTTGMMSSMNSPRLSSVMSTRTVRSDSILYHDSPRTRRELMMLKPLSRLTVLDEGSYQEDSSSVKDLSPRRQADTITERTLLYNDVNCISIAFDAAVSHPSADISRDSLTFSLRSSKQIYGSTSGGTGTRRLRRYPGTLGTRSFSKPGLFYWELVIRFKILRLIRQSVLFEFGLARFDAIDKSYTNDRTPLAWVINGSGCHLCGKVCLHGWHNGQMLSHFPFSNRCPSNVKYHSKLHYGCLFDTSKREWIVVDLKSRAVVAHFRNLLVSEAKEPLWPIFAIYNPEHASTSMEIVYGSDVSGIPEEALDLLSI